MKFHEMRRGDIGTWKLRDLAPNFLKLWSLVGVGSCPNSVLKKRRRYPELIDALLFRLLEYLGWQEKNSVICSFSGSFFKLLTGKTTLEDSANQKALGNTGKNT